jgi:hypothetical protein
MTGQARKRFCDSNRIQFEIHGTHIDGAARHRRVAGRLFFPESCRIITCADCARPSMV